MSYYIIKPLDYDTRRTFILVKKRDIPLEARHSIKRAYAADVHKVGRFSSLLTYLAKESCNEPYTLVRYSWTDVLMNIRIRDEWDTDSESEETSVD
jgi:hypothetical protein